MYILSGKYGLIKGDAPVPLYDYYLESSHVIELAKTVTDQIKQEGITEIDFYIEEKETWKPYIAALEEASIISEIILNKKELLNLTSESNIR